MYKLKPQGVLIDDGVIRIADGVFIPPDPNNPDWRDYQAWAADGNTAYAADYEPGEDAQAKPAPAGKRKAT